MYKGNAFKLPFIQYPLMDIHTDIQPYMTVAPDTMHMPANVSPITKFKVKLTPSNSADYPLSGLRGISDYYHFSSKQNPSIPVD